MTVKEAQQLLNMRAVPMSAQAVTDVYAKKSHALQALLPVTVGKAKAALDQEIAQLSEARDVLLHLVPPSPKPLVPPRSVTKASAPRARKKTPPNTPAAPMPFIDPAIVDVFKTLLRWATQIPEATRRAYTGVVTAYRFMSSFLGGLWRWITTFTRTARRIAKYITERISEVAMATYRFVLLVARWLWRVGTRCFRAVRLITKYSAVSVGLVVIIGVAGFYTLNMIVAAYPNQAHAPAVTARTAAPPPVVSETKQSHTLPIETNNFANNNDGVIGASLSIPESMADGVPIRDEPQRSAPLTPSGAVDDEGNRRSLLDLSDLDFHGPAETPAVQIVEPVNVAETITFDPEEMYLLFHGPDGDRAPGEGVTADGNYEVIREENGVGIGREAQMWEVLERMDAQLTADLIDAELATQHAQPSKCFARFLAWPPCEVYCDERHVTQAPDPTSYEFVSGDNTFRFVHEEELVFEQTLTFQPGAHHIVEVSLLEGTVHVEEE